MNEISYLINAIFIATALGVVFSRNKEFVEKTTGFINDTYQKASDLLSNAFQKVTRSKKKFSEYVVIKFINNNFYYIILLVIAYFIIKWYFFNLGLTEFWSDEYAHLFSAKSLAETGKASLPSGKLYLRSYLYTYLVSLAFKFGKVSEFYARLPSVICAMVLLIITFFTGLKFSNKKVALIAVTLLAFEPFFYWWGRASRMYILFALFFFIFLVIFYYSFEELLKLVRKNGSYVKLFVLIITAGVFLYLSYTLQQLAILALPALAVYPLFHPEVKVSKRVVSIVLASIVALFLFYINFGTELAHRFIPPDLSGKVGVPITLYYLRHFFLNTFGLLGFALYGVYYAFKKKEKFFIFLSVITIIYFAILSTFFANISDGRFMVHILAPFYLLAGLGVYRLFAYIKENCLLLKEGIVKIVVLISIFIALFIGKSNLENIHVFGIEGPPNFRLACDYLKDTKELKYNPKKDVVVSTVPMATMHYLDKTDYWLRQSIDDRFLLKKNGIVSEVYSGVPIIRNNKKMRALLKSDKQVWIILDEKRFRSMLNSDMKQTIGNNTEIVGYFGGTRLLKNGKYENSGNSTDPLFFR